MIRLVSSESPPILSFFGISLIFFCENRKMVFLFFVVFAPVVFFSAMTKKSVVQVVDQRRHHTTRVLSSGFGVTISALAVSQ